ncbi:hypothetical protein A9179_18295 [Pseudomonas alcaligenes]|uniref:Solute-binding protein family 3/N-terminal domain-containing protein n=1 Tax=Aquipseudomonas alcaligenes TaxID=43263 RepID=A0ABR7S682_AQUAC|nr:transporter substrate-binding domain-containing protein [Pseudomonas alcaligenes]MBC9252227.1 hypothetical protein [Pseudomonas alcaligenes]
MRSLLALLCLAAALPLRAEPLTVYYIEKPPYYHTEKGQPTGFLLERTRAIFSQAAIAVHFEARPAKRILLELEQGQAAACSTGWFKTPQREAFARFSRAIYRDEPMTILTRATLQQQLSSYSSLADLLASPLRLGVVDGFSYGELDALLARGNPSRVTAPPSQNVRMLAAERIDYTLVDERELPYILAEADLNNARLSSLKMPDIPPGQRRYLMCSKAVGDEVMKALDRSIQRLGLEP